MAQAVKGWVERCGSLWVSAQVIELNRKTGAIHFLTLRDTSAEVSVAVTLSTAVLDAAGPVSEGMAVTAQLKPTVWMKSGRLSYECSDLRPTGEGQLLAQIEHLKRVLQAEGLFSPSLKRPLPFLPRGIGLITAKASAAERDVVVNVGLRWSHARILTKYALMQGPSTAGQVIAAIRELDADDTIDVIVIARGGGSIEDLLPFSDEGLARAAAAATTPIVSAIGHEVDTPILDLVADLRASTPTDAAKRIVPDAEEELAHIHQARARMSSALLARVAHEEVGLAGIRSRPVLHDPASRFEGYAKNISELRQGLWRAVNDVLTAEETRVQQAHALVRSLSPQSTLARGYAILVDASGAGVSTVNAVSVKDKILGYVSDGVLELAVTGKEKDDGR
jgi:exodeoxyribonuclease VII large subunit